MVSEKAKNIIQSLFTQRNPTDACRTVGRGMDPVFSLYGINAMYVKATCVHKHILEPRVGLHAHK